MKPTPRRCAAVFWPHRNAPRRAPASSLRSSGVQRGPGGLAVGDDMYFPDYIGIMYNKPWNKVSWYIGDDYPTQLYFGINYFISHEIRIPSLTNRDSMECQQGFERCSCTWGLICGSFESCTLTTFNCRPQAPTQHQKKGSRGKKQC